MQLSLIPHSSVLFLCGIAALPACGSDPEERDVTEPGSGDVELLESTCRDYLEHVEGCYGEELDAAFAEEYCGIVAAQYSPGDSPDCGSAVEEVMACLATVDCDELFEPSASHPCAAVAVVAHETCPESNALCVGTFDAEDDSCGLRTEGCFDGKAYAATCTDDGEGVTCACSIDGAETSVAASFTCGDTADGDRILEACDFPEGLLAY